MAEDADGSLLLIPREGDPVRYRDGLFTSEPLPPPYTGRSIGRFLLAKDGAQWFSLKGAVLRIAQNGIQSFEAKDGISAENWTWFAHDAGGRVWLASDGFIGRYEKGQLIPATIDGGGTELRVASSRKGGPWVVTNSRVLKLDDAGLVQEVAAIPALVGAHYVTAAHEDQKGVLWLGTRSQGLFYIREGRHIHVPTSHDDIYAMLEDTEGNLWIAINSGGLNAVAPKTYKLYNKASGLLENATHALCEDRLGDMWFANGDGGVARVHGKEVEHWLTKYDGKIFMTLSVAPAVDGGVWVTGAPGLFRKEKGSDVFHPKEFPASGIRRVSYSARDGALWLSVDPNRIGRLRGDRFEIFGAGEGFDAKEVRAIAEDGRGRIWVGTSDGQVFRLEGERFANVPLRHPKPLSAINAIYFPEGGEIWLGTATHGIVVLGDSQTVVVGATQGLPSDSITQLVADDYGHVWCGSNQGVFRLRQSEVQRFARDQTNKISSLLLGKDEGLRTITCMGIYGPGATKSRDGRIWFATRQGVLAIDPSARVLTPQPPKVAIEQVLCDDVPQLLARPFSLRAEARKLEIQFSVLCLSTPTRVRTRYRLDGFDTDWVHAGTTHSAAYPRLPPGEYQFSVSASFGDHDSGEHVDTISIIVPPQWWQMLWVQLLGVALTLLLVAAMARVWVNRRVKLRVEKLERENAVAHERARIAQNIHDDVGASLTRISLLTQATRPETQPQAQNLNRIYETAREITRSLDEIVWAVNPHYDTLESFISYLSAYSQNFLSIAAVRCRLDIPSALPAIPLSSQMRHDLFLCCREALNNVVKHAKASEVILRLICTPPRLILEISDDGCGLSGGASTADPDRVSTGHGIGNMRQRMSAFAGSCSVKTGPEGGTIVTLQIDLGANGALSP